MVKTCPICSSSFEDKKHPDKKTCSRKCGSHYRIRKKLLDCTHCGKQFLGKAGVLFCSRECYDNHRTESRLLCDHCGSRLPPGRSSKHKHKFCSQSCKTAYFKPKPKPCINCGTIYTPIKFNKVQGKFYANSAMKTCSAKCHIEWIKNDPERKRKISIAFTGAKHPNWQGGKSTINIAVHRGSGWIRIAEKARIRDKHTCQICGKAEEENGRKLDVHHIKA